MTHARLRLIRIIDPQGKALHSIEGSWLSDSCLPSALRLLADCRELEPRAEWRLDCCGDSGNWHEIELASVPKGMR